MKADWHLFAMGHRADDPEAVRLLAAWGLALVLAVVAVVAMLIDFSGGMPRILSFPTIVLLVLLISASVPLTRAWRAVGNGPTTAATMRSSTTQTVTPTVWQRLSAGSSYTANEQSRIQAELDATEGRFRALVETSGDMVWTIDTTGCLTYVNGAAVETILGYRAEEVIGSPFTRFADAATAQRFDEEFFNLLQTGSPLRVDGRYVHRAGHAIYLSINGIALEDPAGRLLGASGTAVNVTEIKVGEALLRQALAEQNAILNSATVGIAIVQDNHIVRANMELERMFGYAPETVIGMAVDSLCMGEANAGWTGTVNSVVIGDDLYDHDHVCRRKDGTDFWCRLAVRAFKEMGPAQGAIWVMQDISDRKQKEQVIEHAALHDALTGLPNRALLSDRLEQTIKQAARTHLKFGVLFLDLDRFKAVNDTVGHDGGDQLLRVVADRLRQRIRNGDTVARQGGDEFILIMPDIRDLSNLERIAQKILEAVAKPITVSGNDYVVTGSIGISVYPDHGTDVQSLLKHADAAMYHAKEVGKATYRVFTEERKLQASEEIVLENALRVALERGQLEVYYQPRVDLASGRIVSVEALARWQHAEMGWISPDKFIPLAERVGLIGRLGKWVLRRACQDLGYLSRLGYPGLGLSVNLSHCQLSDPGLAENVRAILKQFAIEPSRLELELTETAIARNAEQAIVVMQGLKAAGIAIAIDDFGTGYSSLSQLKHFPVRTLKIDRSFVDGLPREEDDAAIVLAIIAIAKRLKMRVVAEGLETDAQRQFLMQHACDQGQGYLFGAAVTVLEMGDVLNARARLAHDGVGAAQIAHALERASAPLA
ncbi:MAG: EAL domain-containing protein [Casimicrobiaceae bacterium]